MTYPIKELRALYTRFIKFSESQGMQDASTLSNVDIEKISAAEIKTVISIYRRMSFFSFLRVLKYFAHSEKVFDILPKIHDLYAILIFVEFLTKENIITVTSNGSITFNKYEWKDILPRPQTEKEIAKVIGKKLGIKISMKNPVTDLFSQMGFSMKTDFDQAPISQKSAFFVIHKILEHLPLSRTFLFVGDDDFMSILLSLVDPSIESVVIDADKSLLHAIQHCAQKNDLRIRTKCFDILNPKKVAGNFTGFLCNPPYTEKGATIFMQYGLQHLGKDGGFAFLEHGNDGVGNRYLFLQKFFSEKQLITEEIIQKKITYPHIGLYEDYEVTNNRLAKFIDPRVIAKQPELAAALYIFNYVPFPIKQGQTKQSIYSYL
ncbi:MAG: bis-aminopropyl spermidine synthase family protein [bacterium]